MTAQEIRSLRKALGMTQEQFARAVGVSLMTVSRWERGVYEPLPVFVGRIEELRNGRRK